MCLIGYVYVLIFPNRKRYIGQTIRSLEQRISQHWYDAKRKCSLPVHSAMQKYGRKGVIIESVFSVYGEQIDLDATEDRYILQYNTLVPNGYNVKRGGRGGHRSCSEETRTKMSLSHKGRSHTEEQKTKMSLAKIGQLNPMKGKTHSEEVKAQISIANTGKIVSEETRIKLSLLRRGRCLSEEHKAKISGTLKGRVFSEETRAKMSKAQRERRQEGLTPRGTKVKILTNHHQEKLLNG